VAEQGTPYPTIECLGPEPCPLEDECQDGKVAYSRCPRNAKVQQGTPEWHALRLGKVTASRFKDVMTNSRTKDPLSKTARAYLLDLLAEKLTLEPQGFEGNKATDWGNEHEADAIACYEAVTGSEVSRAGFFERPELPGVGASPDGFVVGTNGGVEIKCPFNTRIHLEYWLGKILPKDHVAQVQGGMWVTGCDWWDFCSYDPRIQDYKLALFRVRVERDQDYIDKLAFKVADFLNILHADTDTLTQGMNT
jgi:putative phage-type endonuclease